MHFFMYLHDPHHRPVYDGQPENRRTSASTVSAAAAAKRRTHPLREEAARGRRGRRMAVVAAAEKGAEARTRGVEGGLDAPVCASEEVVAGWEAWCNGGSVARP